MVLQFNKLYKKFITASIIENEKFFGLDFIPKKIKKHTEDSWTKKMKEALECRECSLSDNRTLVVYGEGDIKAKVMFIGEAPGAEEDIQGRPFVGRAGKLLDQILHEINWDRKGIYITNIVKCRPPENRQPTPYEIDRCSKFLKFQTYYISPKIIVLLGAVSAQTILGTIVPNLKSIKEIRGQVYEHKGIKYIPTYHPAYILRNQKDYLLLKEDLLKAKKLINQFDKNFK
ncbi:MAG: uracil-DNA glycosylase [Planctomycetota bacterium]